LQISLLPPSPAVEMVVESNNENKRRKIYIHDERIAERIICRP
jgi:hypothetical protein